MLAMFVERVIFVDETTRREFLASRESLVSHIEDVIFEISCFVDLCI